MSGPGGEQLRKSDNAERGMASLELEIFRLKIQTAKGAEIFGAQAGEFVQQLRKRLTLAGLRLCPAIKWFKSVSVAELEDHASAGHPVGAFTVYQVSDNVEGSPGVFAFIAESPGFGQIAQKGVKSSGSACEKGDAVLQVVLWHNLHWMRDGSERLRLCQPTKLHLNNSVKLRGHQVCQHFCVANGKRIC